MFRAASSSDAELAQFLEAGRRAWPDLPLEPEAFLRYVAERRPTCSLAYAADMYLACACAHGVAGAADAFEHVYVPVIERVIARRGVGIDTADASQALLTRLLVAAGGAPKIVEYAGRASLHTWLRIVASRTALMAQRATARRREEDEIGDEVAGGASSPELVALKRRHAADFAAALTRAFDRLSEKERTLLRLYVVERMTFDALADLYKISHSTAARWVTSARTALIQSTRRELRAALRITDSDYDHLAALVQSQLDVSIRKLLRPREGGSSL